ncbi:MAG TPA: hypothetical protein VJY33_24375, partial [Isosphaeraceae bacterium]|nr:hypothetical protein [Isosphaeraceae bacterium]
CKVLLLILVTWVPLVLLSFVSGHAFGDRVVVGVLCDPVILSRFLFVVPLLSFAEIVVAWGLGAQSRHFLESGVVPAEETVEFEAAKTEALRLRDSLIAEGVILVLAVAIAIMSRVIFRLGGGESTWERTGMGITLAGWWHILVSLPILFFFLLRWLWIFLLWSWFLFRVSRLDLDLTPTHPDRSGGLGFLGWGLASFALVLMAISAVLSGSFAFEIVHRGSSLNILKYHIIVFVVLAIVILHAPLLVFTSRLAMCWFRGLLDFGALIGDHDRAFDEKWVKAQGVSRAKLLGSPDVASLADIAQVFEHVERMQLLPFDKKAIIVLVAAALIPMVPLLGTVIGLTDILSMLGKFLV